MRVKIDEKRIVLVIMHIYKAYSSSFKDYKTIYNKRSLLVIETTLRMSSESVLIKNFNFYYIT